MSRHLSAKSKREYLPILIQRDGGFICWYCKVTLTVHTCIYEHLNNNRADNRIDNLVLACFSCNNKKPNDFDMQTKATDKLRANEDRNFVGEKMYEDTSSPSTEITINLSNFEITEQYVRETIVVDGRILFSEALDSIVYLCKKNTGHGSHQSVRNYLKSLTSKIAPFKIIKEEDKKKYIVKRNEN
ncbi:MAG: HNH endonuclease [Nitrosopumilus sp.]|nr:HNH endonuclease [Nitrosopumilus sp.]MDH3822274.1 HNH endonuclease [Nitrosopumilus sp.]MDH3833075.1 HNH endonuclease [Nitrosopumilus sp.]